MLLKSLIIISALISFSAFSQNKVGNYRIDSLINSFLTELNADNVSDFGSVSAPEQVQLVSGTFRNRLKYETRYLVDSTRILDYQRFRESDEFPLTISVEIMEQIQIPDTVDVEQTIIELKQGYNSYGSFKHSKIFKQCDPIQILADRAFRRVNDTTILGFGSMQCFIAMDSNATKFTVIPYDHSHFTSLLYFLTVDQIAEGLGLSSRECSKEPTSLDELGKAVFEAIATNDWEYIFCRYGSTHDALKKSYNSYDSYSRTKEMNYLEELNYRRIAVRRGLKDISKEYGPRYLSKQKEYKFLELSPLFEEHKGANYCSLVLELAVDSTVEFWTIRCVETDLGWKIHDGIKAGPYSEIVREFVNNKYRK